MIAEIHKTELKALFFRIFKNPMVRIGERIGERIFEEEFRLLKQKFFRG